MGNICALKFLKITFFFLLPSVVAKGIEITLTRNSRPKICVLFVSGHVGSREKRKKKVRRSTRPHSRPAGRLYDVTKGKEYQDIASGGDSLFLYVFRIWFLRLQQTGNWNVVWWVSHFVTLRHNNNKERVPASLKLISQLLLCIRSRRQIQCSATHTR
jgi:hypothetical protein